MGPKRPSGNDFRKVKKQKGEENKKLSSTLGNWLIHVEQEEQNALAADETDSTLFPEQDNETVLGESSNSQIAPMEVVTNSEVNESEPTYFARASCSTDPDEVCTSITDAMRSSTNAEIEIIYEDPKKWPVNFRLDAIRCKLVEQGPQTIDLNNYTFPYTEDGRHFSPKWFFKTLTNGEKVKRRWLLYSQSKDKLFCFPCLLFSKADKSPFSDFEKGFNDWKHLNPFIHVHETSATHRNSYVEWKELEIRLKACNTIDADFEKGIQAETEKWRCILKCIVDVIIHCARNNLPLRGSSDAIGDNNCGVFLSTLELISHYNPQLLQHIESIKSKKHVPSYFSPKIQNEVIEILGNKVRSEILTKVKNAKYFSIIFDCTPDTAHIEQMSQIIRYVNIEDEKCLVEESFVDFIISHQKTGRNLSEEILQKLSNDGLDIKNCRGQGFDNGSNMAGKYEGVQAHILRINDLAQYVPCAAHSLNLVGVHAAEVSVLMISFFGKVTEFFNFFSASTLRWEALTKCVKTTLKRHCETRWSSRRQALTALQKNLSSIHEVLQQMTDRTNNWNPDTASGAMMLLRQIDFEFVSLLEMWTEVLVKLDLINKSLQGKRATLDLASNLLSGLAENIQDLRDEGIEKYIAKAKIVCDSLSIKSSLTVKRLRKIKRMAGELAEDETPLISAEKSFELECLKVYDRLITEIKRRSDIYNSISSDFSFLSGKTLYESSVPDLQKCAADLGAKYSQDIDTLELVNEVGTFKFQVKELVKNISTASHLDILKVISKYGLKHAYPNIEIALRIFLTMPVSVASCERSFSKLKLIKNYLRSSMGESRLSNLAILSIEYEMAAKLDFNEVINEFASIKARKLKL